MALILVVDDDFDSSAALAGFLRRSGHTVQHIADGQQAIMAVIELPPDIVVLDMKMPYLSGIGFLKVVRSYLRLAKLPIILWTGHDEAEEIDQALKLGVEAVLVKGRADLKDILDEVNRIIA